MNPKLKDALIIFAATALIVGSYAVYDNLPAEYQIASIKEKIAAQRYQSNKFSRIVKKFKPARRLPAEITTLPNIQGHGDVPSLREAMMKDKSGVLKELVKKTETEKNPQKRKQLINDIIFHWAGVADVDPQSRKPEGFDHNPLGDVRYLLVLEKILGEKYQNIHRLGEEANKPRGKNEIGYVHKAYNEYFIYVESYLNMQTILYPYYFDKFTSFDSPTSRGITQEEKIIRTLRELNDKEYKLYLLETIELADRVAGVFDARNFRMQAKPDSDDAFEKYLKDFGNHKHDYRFTVKENKISGKLSGKKSK